MTIRQEIAILLLVVHVVILSMILNPNYALYKPGEGGAAETFAWIIFFFWAVVTGLFKIAIILDLQKYRTHLLVLSLNCWGWLVLKLSYSGLTVFLYKNAKTVFVVGTAWLVIMEASDALLHYVTNKAKNAPAKKSPEQD